MSFCASRIPWATSSWLKDRLSSVTSKADCVNVEKAVLGFGGNLVGVQRGLDLLGSSSGLRKALLSVRDGFDDGLLVAYGECEVANLLQGLCGIRYAIDNLQAGYKNMVRRCIPYCGSSWLVEEPQYSHLLKSVTWVKTLFVAATALSMVLIGPRLLAIATSGTAEDVTEKRIGIKVTSLEMCMVRDEL